MKISLLIPSKNRLELLKQTVASIFDQDGMEFEIVITDNNSAEDYQGYVDSLKDHRVVFFRQPEPVSVTQNWHQALSLATGDYILMLGDDDALAPDFYSIVRQHLTPDGADILYLASYNYCYPNVLPDSPAGFLASVLNSEFFAGKKDAFSIAPSYAHDLALSVLDFHHRFGLNAQHFLVKAAFCSQFDAIGGIYQSPYPDTFSAVATFIHARSIVVLPKESVIIGISPKSFGAYYFSGRHDEGYRFLDNEQVEPAVRASLESVILPGDKNNTNWLIAVECVRQAFPDKLTQPVNFARYRALQMIVVLRDTYLLGRGDHLGALSAKLSGSELLLFQALESAFRVATEARCVRQIYESISAQLHQYAQATVTTFAIGPHAQMWDAYVWLKEHENATSRQTGSLLSKPRDYARAASRRARTSFTNVRDLFRPRADAALKVSQLEAENASLRRQLDSGASAPNNDVPRILPEPNIRSSDKR
jgi:glycosyltransferase involved in cell wall biosynthesis